jgi:hypothetical protein
LRQEKEKWRKDHPEEARLNSRNWTYRHPEQHKQQLESWRKRNPDKVSLQNKRAKINIRRRKERNLREQGIYPKIKWSIICPKCKHEMKTAAKRPGCSCGYVFPRDYMEKFIDRLETTPCKCCGREIPFQEKGKGRPRAYCECCSPQITALKRVFTQMRREENNPDANEKWYRNNMEIVVAVTCIFCDNIILGRGSKRICHDCYLKWGRQIPRKIRETLTSWPSFKLLPPDLLAWRRIEYYRKRGIYTLK